MITITIDTDNDTFSGRPGREVARILERLAREIRDSDPDDWPEKLRDTNGNTCGRVEVVDLPEPEPEPDRVRHTACHNCELDIEGIAPFKAGEWRDRGNNTTCPHGPAKGRNHTPYRG